MLNGEERETWWHVVSRFSRETAGLCEEGNHGEGGS